MLSIDRFEGRYAVCVDDDKNVVWIKRRKIRGKAKEGDLIREENGIYIIMEEATQREKEEIMNLQDELFE